MALPAPTANELLDFQDHLIHDGLELEHAQFMIYWIFHYRENEMTWDDIWGIWTNRDRFLAENPPAEEERKVEEEDAMEGPDEYVHASNSLDSITLEDTDWPWAHNQYRAYHG